MTMKGVMMKKGLSGFAIIALCLVAVSAMADYTNPPDWSSNPYYTHQSWEFNPAGWDGDDPIQPTLPLEPDAIGSGAGWINPNGTPYLLYDLYSDPDTGSWAWESMGGITRTGLYGGMGSTALVFEVPNEEVEGLQKEIWVQWEYYTTATTPPPNWAIEVGRGIDVTTDPAYLEDVTITGTEGITQTWFNLESGLPGGGSNPEAWYRVTAKFLFDDQPGVEYIKITASTMYGASMIDQVHINTQCIPEPGTISLLGAGFLGLVALRRRSRK